MNITCPFCKPTDKAFKGTGCCFCDYTGLIPEEDHRRLLNPNLPNDEKPYPFFSDYDLRAGRQILKNNKK